MLKRILTLVLLAMMAGTFVAGCVKINGDDDEPQVELRAGDTEFEAN